MYRRVVIQALASMVAANIDFVGVLLTERARRYGEELPHSIGLFEKLGVELCKGL